MLVRPLRRGKLDPPWMLLLHKQKQLLVLHIYIQSCDCAYSLFYVFNVSVFPVDCWLIISKYLYVYPPGIELHYYKKVAIHLMMNTSFLILFYANKILVFSLVRKSTLLVQTLLTFFGLGCLFNVDFVPYPQFAKLKILVPCENSGNCLFYREDQWLEQCGCCVRASLGHWNW